MAAALSCFPIMPFFFGKRWVLYSFRRRREESALEFAGFTPCPWRPMLSVAPQPASTIRTRRQGCPSNISTLGRMHPAWWQCVMSMIFRTWDSQVFFSLQLGGEVVTAFVVVSWERRHQGMKALLPQVSASGWNQSRPLQ